jgi:aminopeptidase N
MATMIHNSSFETALHEWCHSWYQMMLGTNENLYAWMDEGFTDYAEARVLAWLHKADFFEGAAEYDQYYFLARSPFDEPMSTHANYYRTNLAYNTNAYYKGAVFLRQLGYIVGEPAIDKILMAYYQQWRFKHPTPNDFVRIAEKTSGMQLQWYKEYMMNTTKTINYSIDSLWEMNGVTKVRLQNIGQMPMPLDVKFSFKDGSSEWHYIPLSLQFGEKPAENFQTPRIVYEEWKWTHATYEIQTKKKLTDIVSIEIDPTQRLADTDRKNNRLELKW